MNVTELAQYCSTSPATITRMCKSLGYSGYKDFIKDLMLDVSHYMYMLKEMKGRDGHPFLSGYLHHVISYDAKKQWV